MLDARFICGDRKVANKFIAKFLRYCRKKKPGDYLHELLGHQQERRSEKGNTVFLQAPDLKNGLGGLRDYQGVLWMAKVKFEDDALGSLVKRGYLNEHEAKSYQEAYSFLLRVRNDCTSVKDRWISCISRNNLKLLSAWAIWTRIFFPRVEKFMGFYARANTIHQLSHLLEQRLVGSSSGNTSSISFRSVLNAYKANPAEKVDGFELQDGVLHTDNAMVFDEDPERILRLFRHAQRLGAKLSPSLRSLVRNRLSSLMRV